MKSIGVNRWAGADPWVADMVRDLEQQAARTRQAERDRWKRLSPSEKFFRLRMTDCRFPSCSVSHPCKGTGGSGTGR